LICKKAKIMPQIPCHARCGGLLLTEIAKKRGEIVAGYKKNNAGVMLVRANPKKSDRVTFTDDDYLIVVAEDNN
jgi:hypothetical protein